MAPGDGLLSLPDAAALSGIDGEQRVFFYRKGGSDETSNTGSEIEV